METTDTQSRQDQERLEARREVKVRLPVRQLIHLHGVKLVHGRTISDTVEEALDAWFTAEGIEPEGAADDGPEDGSPTCP